MFEEIVGSLMGNSVTGTAAVMVARNVIGWLKNSLEDYKPSYGLAFWKAFQPYEIAELAKTVLRLGYVGGAIYFGAGAFDLGLSVQEATLASATIDVIKGLFKKK